MGILRRKKLPTPPAEQEHPTFGLTRVNPYTNGHGDLVLPDRGGPHAPLPPVHTTIMDIDHPARQEVVVHTSALDRAKGFQAMIAPISIAFAVLVLIVSLFFTEELFTLTSLGIFWGTFCLVYGFCWLITMVMTAEFVSLVSAVGQLLIIGREQLERWAHYRGTSVPWWIEYKLLISILIILVAVGLFFVGIAVLLIVGLNL